MNENNMIKFILNKTKEHTKEVVLVIFGLALLSFLQFLNPQITKIIIDKALPNHNRSLLIKSVMGMLLISALLGIINYLVSIMMTQISQQILTKLRVDLFAHILKQDFAFFEHAKTGDLMTRLNSDIRTIQGLISTQSLSMISTMLQFFLILVFMFISDVKLTIMVILTFPILYGLNRSFAINMRKTHRKIRSNASALSNHLQTSLSSMLLIKNFNAEKMSLENYYELNEISLEESVKANKLSASLSPLIQFTNVFATSLVWLWGGMMIIKGEMSLGDVLAYISYLAMVQSPIRSFSSMVHRYQEAKVSFERIEELLNVSPQITKIQNPLPFVHDDIFFKDVSFHYSNQKEVLRNINITLKMGEVNALVGTSGSGKTTLIKLLSRLYDPIEGEIYLGKTPLNHIELESLRNNIAIVSQDVIIIDGSIYENLVFGQTNITQEKLIEACQNANIYDFILSLEDGFETQVGERGIKLSGGQKQRLAIARIFLKNAPILILDEATASLDNESEKLIQAALDKLIQNRTTLVIAHRLSTIQNANKIMVMERGQIIEEGKHEALLDKKGRYYTLYQAQFNEGDSQ